MPFHLKKFYEKNKNKYLYFQNFYDPLNQQQKENNKTIYVYLRNLNIFREYIPQNIITKYFNLNSFTKSKDFPQLLVSFPFSNVEPISGKTFQMKGYNYFIRDDNGNVDENQIKITNYNLVADSTGTTLRPPRKLWRLN